MSLYFIGSPSEVLCCVQVTPTAEEAGHCDVVEVTEIGDTNIVVFKQGKCRGLMNSYYCFLLRKLNVTIVTFLNVKLLLDFKLFCWLQSQKRVPFLPSSFVDPPKT